MSTSLIVTILLTIATSAGAAAFINGYFQRPKTRAEAQDLIAKAGISMDARYLGLINQLEKALDEVREEVAGLKAKQTENEKLIAKLKTEIRAERHVSQQLIRYMLDLRTEIERLGGQVPDMPREVDTYITTGRFEDEE